MREDGGSSSSNADISSMVFDGMSRRYRSEPWGQGRMGFGFVMFWLRYCSLVLKWFLFRAYYLVWRFMVLFSVVFFPRWVFGFVMVFSACVEFGLG